jgi:hypothetical protein
MKELIKTVLFSSGYRVVRHTKLADLRELLSSLQPEICGRDLVRIGGDGDGGYLLPDDLDGIEYCFSPGVSSIADFENQLADRGIRSFMADYSVKEPPLMRPEFCFEKKYLGATEDEVFTTLATWKQRHLGDYSGDMILQMDIEGFEYEVLLNLPDSLLNQFRIIVIEFHHLDLLFDPFMFRHYRSCFQKLLKYFHVAHIHPNNWDKVTNCRGIEIPHMLEFTFYSRKRAHPAGKASRFPHPLDRDNVPENRPLNLPRDWYSNAKS